MSRIIAGLAALAVLAGGGSLRAADPGPAVPHLPAAHSLQVTGAAGLASKDLLVTSAADGRVKVWQPGTGLLISEYATEGGAPISGLAADPRHPGQVAISVLDGQESRLAMAGGRGEIRVLDLATNTIVRSFGGQAGRLTYSPAGRWLTSAAYSLLSIWDAETGKLWLSLQGEDGIEGATFADENTLVFRRDGRAVFLDLLSGRTRSLATGAGGAMAVSKDGALLAEVGDKELRIWRLSDGQRLASRPLIGSPRFIYFARDGSVVAGGHFASIFSGSATNFVHRLKPDGWTLETFTVGHSPISLVADGGDSALVGQQNGRIQRIDFDARTRKPDLGADAGDVTALGFDPLGRYLAAGLSGGAAVVWEPASNWYRVLDPLTTLDTLPKPEFSEKGNERRISATYRTGEGLTNAAEIGREKVVGLAFLTSETLLLVHESGKAEVIDVTTASTLKAFSVDNPVKVVRGDGAAVIVCRRRIAVVSAAALSVHDFDLAGIGPIAAAVAPGGDRVLVLGLQGTVEVNTKTGAVVPSSAVREGTPFSTVDGTWAALTWSAPPGPPRPDGAGGTHEITDWRDGVGVLARPEGIARIWRSRAADAVEVQTGGSISAVAVSPDRRTVAFGSGHGRIAFRTVEDGAAVLELMTLDHRGWLARSASGHFDGSYAAWSMIRGSRPGALLDAETPFALFGAWFRPRLLSAVLADEALEDVPGVGDPAAARAPAVRIVSPRSNYVRQFAPPSVSTKQLVGDQRRDEKGEAPAWEVIAPNRENSQVEGTRIGLEAAVDVVFEAADLGGGVGECRVFRNRRLLSSVKPRLADGRAPFGAVVPLRDGDNVVSAYCFSGSGERSEEAELHLYGAPSLKAEKTAYILAIGIDGYADGHKLRYAKADAALARSRLEEALGAVGGFKAIVPVVLEDATAAEILRGIRILAGSEPPPATGPLSNLRRSTPSDTVFVFFAGHGGGVAGEYRLIAADGRFGTSSTQGMVSASELRGALEPLQADRAVLIIDACEAGQALDQVDPRAGPLAGRSLAQLAYDKAMFVISGAQSRESALELQRLGHGLFSYVLFQEGLDSRADENKDGVVTVREWLDFAQTRTPREQDAQRAAVLSKRGQADATRTTFADEPLNYAQTPRVFVPDPVLAREFVIVQAGGRKP